MRWGDQLGGLDEHVRSLLAVSTCLCLCLPVASCTRGPGQADEASASASQTETETESGSESGEEGFDPFVCGSWEAEPIGPPGQLPTPACTDAGESGCPRFADVTEASFIQHQQYIAVSGARAECMFDLASGEGIVPNADCEPQWFTGGAAAADVDGDGWVDLFVTRLGAPDLLYMNRGDGHFEDQAQARGLGECSFSNGAVFGDIDNDGDPDLLVTSTGDTRYYLFENDGAGHFVERGQAWGFDLQGEVPHGGESVTLGDYDLDGRLDVHVNAWIEPHNVSPDDPDDPTAFEAPGPHGSRLLHNEGERLVDVTESAGVSLLGADPDGIYGFASSFVDLDDDGWPELVIAADFRSSRLFWNETGTGGNTTFSDGTQAAGVNTESNAMGSTFGDFDGDGRLDWFVTSIGERDASCPDDCPWKSTGNRLYRNRGDRSFDRVEEAVGVRDAGWAWGTTMFDMDNDGDLDLYAVNGWPGRDLNGGLSHRASPARLWRNDGGSFDEVATELGADDRGQGRAVLSFDYDNDGDVDLFIANHAQAPTLLRNEGGNQKAWLQVHVEGTTSNRDGRGAVVEVQVEVDGPWQRRQVGAGSHFLGEGPNDQHFGLGEAFDPTTDTIAQVRVRWPASGAVQLLADVPANQRLVVREDE